MSAERVTLPLDDLLFKVYNLTMDLSREFLVHCSRLSLESRDQGLADSLLDVSFNKWRKVV